MQKKIDFIFDCPFKKLDVWMDPDKVDKIFFNLLSNAFKFTPEKGQIAIRLSQIVIQDKEGE